MKALLFGLKMRISLGLNIVGNILDDTSTQVYKIYSMKVELF